ncbi:MAG: YlbL family protein [Bacillota bacterium]
MRKNNSYKDKITKLIGVIIIFLIISNFIPTPYMMTTPGVAKELSPLITVKDGYKNNTDGKFMLTAVGSKRATVLDFIKITIFSPEGYELTPRQQQIPEGMEMDQYIDIMANLMEESKVKAQAVALKKAGYEVSFEGTGNGAEIVQVMEGGSAEGKLEAGDVITAVDGKEVKLASDAVNLIRAKKIGEKIDLTVKNNGDEKIITLETVELEENPDQPSIGVLIITKGLTYDFPREITFDTDNVVGPSAGSVFTLEIYNQLVPEDITKGKKIAGTGTISLDGKIGMIDGILQKIITADESEADIFLVPAENFDKAQETTRDIELVKVENIDDVIDYLENELK